MPDKLQIIVLHTLKYKDSSLILQGYSNLNGRQSYIVRKRKPGNAFISQLQALDIIDAEIVPGGKGSMSTIKEFVPAFTFQDIRYNLNKCSIAMFISELIYRIVREVEPNRVMYDFIRSSILTLETLKNGYSNFHTWFIVEMCKQSGYDPLLSIGDFSGRSYEILAKLLNIDPAELNTVKLNGKERYIFIKDMLSYLSQHIGFPIEVKSLEVLHQVLGQE
ncbi:MAG TPA: DNA repair protein RecO [Bacteroidales bacterium]|nr:DNA repair protein RecO [Bacteroidales bacterium]